MEILLIGAGQLGSRHLQGLVKLKEKHLIYVLDPSKHSLDIAKRRSEEINHLHSVYFVENWDILPKRFDLCIIATNANIREEITSKLLKDYIVSNLLLEKVLFQEISSYHKIGELISKSGVKTWVNHPRRMLEQYKEIKDTIGKSQEQITFNVNGGNWGMGCNGLHFIDFFTFITGSKVEKIETDWIDDCVRESKRQNCIEFSGTLKGRTIGGSYFFITSFNEHPAPITITISSASNRWFIQEGAGNKILHSNREKLFSDEEVNFKMDVQSDLTTKVVEDIFNHGKCDLPTYEEACETHILFIEAFLKKYNLITNIDTSICPIT